MAGRHKISRGDPHLATMPSVARSESLDLASASFSYPQHDGVVRAELARRLMSGAQLEAGFILSTCLRVEIVVPGGEQNLRNALDSLFGDLAETERPRIRRGEKALAHMYRIVAGLESPILGEREILTQFRQALIRSEESGAVHGLFARLLESAIAIGRQTHELLPGSPHSSMAAVAAQAVGAADRVAVLGSGAMATAVVDDLSRLPASPRVTVVARNPEKAAQFPGVAFVPFEEAIEVLSHFPAVISATSAKRRLVDEEAMTSVIAQRAEPLLLIDMAMPPDFSPPAGSNVTYLDIDDLATMADRPSQSEEADRFVESAASEAFRQYRDHREIGPLIGDLMRHADKVVDSVVGRFSGKLVNSNDDAILRQTAHTVARTLLAGPVSYLKQGNRLPEATEVFADAFGVEA